MPRTIASHASLFLKLRPCDIGLEVALAPSDDGKIRYRRVSLVILATGDPVIELTRPGGGPLVITRSPHPLDIGTGLSLGLLYESLNAKTARMAYDLLSQAGLRPGGRGNTGV